MEVCIVLLNWNDSEVTIEALERLRSGDWRDTAVAVLDNGSTDESISDIEAWAEGASLLLSESLVDGRETWPRRLVLLRSSGNLGTTGGPNQVIRQALAAWPSLKYILLMNNDAEVTWTTVDELIHVARESGAAVVGASVDDGHGPFTRERWPLDLFSYGLATRSRPPDTRWWRSGSYHGAAVLYRAAFVRRQIAERGQFLNEALFMYWDEADLSRSAEAMGENVVVAGQAHVPHGRAVGGRNGRERSYRDYYLVRNRLLTGRRWLPRPANALFVGYECFRVGVVSLLRSPFAAGRRRARAELLGAWDGFRGKTGKWRHH